VGAYVGAYVGVFVGPFVGALVGVLVGGQVGGCCQAIVFITQVVTISNVMDSIKSFIFLSEAFLLTSHFF
jgi:hypothetical protein